MEIMDHFAYELLSQPLPPGFDDPFSGSNRGDGYDATDTEQLDNYFRAIGVLPPLLPPANNAHVQPAPPAASSYDDGTYDSDDDDDDIDASLRAMETDASIRQRPSPDPVVRAALVPWMRDFARHFGVGQGALHRAVSYADRFLSARARAVVTAGVDVDVEDYRLRLLGAAAVYAASKYEDRGTAPTRMNARDIAARCGFAASREVLDTERALLAALGYRLGAPTAHTFVEHFTRRHVGREVRRVAHAVADSSLLDHRCLELLPSAVAAAAILLSWLCLEPSHAHDREQVRRWSRELEELTGYKPMDVYDGLDCMYSMLPHDPGFDISPLLFADPIPS